MTSSTFITNDELKAALVAYLKSKSVITAALTTANEIREQQWQGVEFVYPAIRVAINSNRPDGDNGCVHTSSVSIRVFSEEASSLQCDQIAGIIATVLNGRQFSSNNIAFWSRVTNLIPAFRRDMRTWVSEVLLNCQAS